MLNFAYFLQKKAREFNLTDLFSYLLVSYNVFRKIYWFPTVYQSLNAKKYPKIAKKRKILPVFSEPRTKNAEKKLCDFFSKIQCICDILLKTKRF